MYRKENTIDSDNSSIENVSSWPLENYFSFKINQPLPPSIPILETQPLPVNSLSVPCSRDRLIESLLSWNKRSTSRGEIVERAKLSFEFSNTVDVPRGRTGSLPLRNSLIQIVQSEVDKKTVPRALPNFHRIRIFIYFLLLTL